MDIIYSRRYNKFFEIIATEDRNGKLYPSNMAQMVCTCVPQIGDRIFVPCSDDPTTALSELGLNWYYPPSGPQFGVVTA